MKIIKPSVEFFGAVPTDYTNTLRFIEMAGRTCYKSEDKITADSSAEPFVKRLVSSGHLAMVEHSNFVVRVSMDYDPQFHNRVLKLAGKYLNIIWQNNYCHVGGSLTAWYQQMQLCSGVLFETFADVYAGVFQVPDHRHPVSEHNWQVCPHNEIPKELHRYSAKFICDRGVSHELVRHRPCSFAQESTRYVNYGGKDMEFIEPAGFEEWTAFNNQRFKIACIRAQDYYNDMLAYGLKPQQARAILPNALKTEIVVTADAAEWAHIRKLRTHPTAHPDMVRLMNMMPWEDFL
jgi:thymidylate synthase (FAD)